jgi:hypothetical protein
VVLNSREAAFFEFMHSKMGADLLVQR